MPSDPQKIESFLSKLEEWNEKCQTGVTIEGPHALFAANLLKEAPKLLKAMRVLVEITNRVGNGRPWAHCNPDDLVMTTRNALSEVAKLLSESEGE